MNRSRQRGPEEGYVIFRIFNLFERIITLAVPWGSAIWIAYLFRDSVFALAGKTTLANIGMGLKADIRITDAVAYLFGIGGVGWGMSERRLRRRHIESTSGHVQALETAIDSRRTSSRLTRRGTTRPEDKV